MKKLCIFTLYSDIGASSNYRILQFTDVLRTKYEIRSFHFWNDRYTTKYVRNKKKYALHIVGLYLWSIVKRIIQLLLVGLQSDIVFFQKGCIPKMDVKLLILLKKHGVKIALDVDDAIYLDQRDTSNQIARIADLVICGNSFLKEHYDQFSTNCVILPTVDRNDLYKRYHQNTYNKKVIGWLGSGATINNLNIVIEPMKTIIRNHPETRFMIVSDTPGNYIEKIPNSYFVKWDKRTYLKELGDFSIGIMPLEDNDYNRGKCGFKIIQYLSMEKPVIASDVGVNGEIVGRAGYVVQNEEEWVSTIEKLLFDEKEYKQCLSYIRTDFYTKYSYKNVGDRLVELLDTL